MRFVLVHGGAHGAWCWDLLVPELSALGHQAVTPELPGHGARQRETATVDGYRDAVLEYLEPGDVLVGHSLGAPVAVMAADRFPNLEHLCILAGQLPVDGRPLHSLLPAPFSSQRERW